MRKVLREGKKADKESEKNRRKRKRGNENNYNYNNKEHVSIREEEKLGERKKRRKNLKKTCGLAVLYEEDNMNKQIPNLACTLFLLLELYIHFIVPGTNGTRVPLMYTL